MASPRRRPGSRFGSAREDREQDPGLRRDDGILYQTITLVAAFRIALISAA